MNRLAPLLTALCCAVASAASAQMRYSGSDSVLPVVEAATMAYARGHQGFKLQSQVNGSSSGIRDLCASRVALAGSSRPIKPDEQRDCGQAGVAPVEIPVAIDAVVLVTSPKNTWLKSLAIKELQHIFAHASAGKIMSWKQVRPEFPDVPLKTVGVGIKHGTFQLFVDAIGNGQFIRPDFKDTSAHADTVKLVAADAGAIGFVPYATMKDFKAQLHVVSVDFGAGPVLPSRDTLIGGQYAKLGRMVYLYANLALLERNPDEKDFARFLLSDLERYVSYANLTTLAQVQYQEGVRRVGFVR